MIELVEITGLDKLDRLYLDEPNQRFVLLEEPRLPGRIKARVVDVTLGLQTSTANGRQKGLSVLVEALLIPAATKFAGGGSVSIDRGGAHPRIAR